MNRVMSFFETRSARSRVKCLWESVLLAFLISASLVGCSQGGFEVVESPSSVVTMTVGPVDEFHVVPPEGWVMIPLGRKWGFVQYFKINNTNSRVIFNTYFICIVLI